MPVKPRKKIGRSKKSSTRTRRPADRQAGTPLSRDIRVGAAALGILGIVVLVTMVAARPRAGAAEAAGSAARSPNATASEALIAEATAPVPPAAPSEPKEVGTVTAPVTITGCLERADDAFRLKDTEGDDAPRARSWKSGFLKKSTASIQVVDAANRVKLPAHVGQRVAVTGTLIDRELRVRSLRSVASTCAGSKTKV